MLKKIAFVLAIVFMLSLVGCNDSKEKDASNPPSSVDINVGEKDGVAYFERSEGVPEIIVEGKTEKKIKDAELFENLVRAIDGQSIVKDVCNCEALYIIHTGGYTFGLHTHNSIAIYSGNTIHATNLIGMIDECPDGKMNKLFEILSQYPNIGFSEIHFNDKNGKACLVSLGVVPEIVVQCAVEKRIYDKDFFENLVSAIDGKEIVGICDCAPKCSIRVDKYTFRLKDDAIELFEEANGENKFLGMVECTREEMNELFTVINPNLIANDVDFPE